MPGHQNDILCRYTRGGLIEQAFYIQIANALLPELVELLSPYTLFLSRILVRSTLVTNITTAAAADAAVAVNCLSTTALSREPFCRFQRLHCIALTVWHASHSVIQQVDALMA